MVLVMLVALFAEAGSQAEQEAQQLQDAQPTSTGGPCTGSGMTLDETAQVLGMPVVALDAYCSAATRWNVDWAVLAGIGKIECDHGRSRATGCPPHTANQCGARGPMQFLGNTWRSGTDTVPSGQCPGPASFTADPT